jgi:hypothetical protein
MEQVTRLVGVYHADGDLRGELTYWIKARFGAAHCALCDITHGTFGRKGDWVTCEQGLGVEFTTFHLNDRPGDVAAASEGATPCVLAETAAGTLVMLVGPGELEECAGDPERLMDAISQAAAAAGLVVPMDPRPSGDAND